MKRRLVNLWLLPALRMCHICKWSCVIDPVTACVCVITGKCCGESGTVCLARYLPTQALVAVKKINLDHCDMDLALLRVRTLALYITAMHSVSLALV